MISKVFWIIVDIALLVLLVLGSKPLLPLGFFLSILFAFFVIIGWTVKDLKTGKRRSVIFHRNFLPWMRVATILISGLFAYFFQGDIVRNGPEILAQDRAGFDILLIWYYSIFITILIYVYFIAIVLRAYSLFRKND